MQQVITSDAGNLHRTRSLNKLSTHESFRFYRVLIYILDFKVLLPMQESFIHITSLAIADLFTNN